MTEHKQNFSLAGLLVMIGVSVLLAAVLLPLGKKALMQAGMSVVGARGKDIFVAITAASAEREPLGLGNVWPRAQAAEIPRDESGPPPQDIADMTFRNAVDYFKVLYDEDRVATPDWQPYVGGFDYSKLAGEGVERAPGERLKADYCIWCIAGNIRDDMGETDIIPVLITRNVDCSSLYKDYDGEADTPLRWSQRYKTPYGKKMFFIVRQGGATFSITAKYATARTIYYNQPFRTTVEGKAPLVYLTPDGIAIPQDMTGNEK